MRRTLVIFFFIFSFRHICIASQRGMIYTINRRLIRFIYDPMYLQEILIPFINGDRYYCGTTDRMCVMEVR